MVSLILLDLYKYISMKSGALVVYNNSFIHSCHHKAGETLKEWSIVTQIDVCIIAEGNRKTIVRTKLRSIEMGFKQLVKDTRRENHTV
jgi:hypothetical protein